MKYSSRNQQPGQSLVWWGLANITCQNHAYVSPLCSHVDVATLLPSFFSLHVPVPETSARRLWPCWSLCAPTGQCSPSHEHVEKHTESNFGFSQDSLPMVLGCIQQKPIVYAHYTPLYLLSSSNSQLHVCLSITLWKVHFRMVWAFSAKLSCCKGFLRERCVSCMCSVHTLPPEERTAFPWEAWFSYSPLPSSDSHRQALNAWQHTIFKTSLGMLPTAWQS